MTEIVFVICFSIAFCYLIVPPGDLDA